MSFIAQNLSYCSKLFSRTSSHREPFLEGETSSAYRLNSLLTAHGDAHIAKHSVQDIFLKLAKLQAERISVDRKGIYLKHLHPHDIDLYKSINAVVAYQVQL